ncbi:hypothetical protein Cgig2_016996 [Carnegiea gigantea]|uniref:pectinesterase n=1 Tax=Carnegiea gigantea TaxID=171969 RepID=A0A9Q1KHN7_9CARY|nr:hypothetical protein Cgig2_016996 [Carnegiea gigantea]
MSKVVVITLASVVLVGLIAAITMGFVTNWGKQEEDKKAEATTKAVQAICQPTDFKEACFKSLSNVDTDNPKELVRAAFRSAKEELNAVYHNSSVLRELENDPRTADSIKVCRELFVDAMQDLQRSFEGLEEFEWNRVTKVLAKMKSWLSATITYQETCLDGFENTTADAAKKVQEVLKLAMEMSSNGLAIIMDMSQLIGSIDVAAFNRRRLLSYSGPRVGGHAYNDRIPFFLDKHPHEDNRRWPNLGPKADAHTSQGSIPYWLDKNPYKNRRLMNLDNNDDGGTLFEDDEPDNRRRRILSFLHDRELDDEELPIRLGSDDGPPKEFNLMKDIRHIADVVVDKNGSGKYKTIEEALKDIPKYGSGNKFIIYIKKGVYNEYLVVEKSMKHVVFVGDGPTKTRITNNKNFIDGTKTYKTATLCKYTTIEGDYFMAKDIGIENTAGAAKHQAVALRVQADQSIFYNCHMDGYQDTLYVHTYRQFYRNCRITGTIDFIFGDAAAFFQNCTFVVRKPLPNQDCIVTAQGRMERHQPTGIIIHKCRFEADPDYYPLRRKNKAYLGRPWKEYSRTIIMESYIGDLIQPQGWLPWDGNFALETCYYSEFINAGPGAKLANRAKWRGVKIISYDSAEKFMPPNLFEIDEWIKDSGVPYDATLSIAFAPGMAPDGAPAGAPYAMDASFPEDGSSSMENDDDDIGQTLRNKEHGGGKSSYEKHKDKKDGDKSHKNEKSSDHKHRGEEHRKGKSSDQEHKGEDKDGKSGDQENKGDKEKERSSESKHKVGENKGGKSGNGGHKEDKSSGQEGEGKKLSDQDHSIVDAPASAPAPAPFDSTLTDELFTLNAKLSTSFIEETASTQHASLREGEKKPIGEPELERALMDKKMNGMFNDGALSNSDANNLAMVQPFDPMHNPSIEAEKPMEPLTIHELERMLMANEEEIEPKTNPVLSSNVMLRQSRDPIEVHEMERMLMADEEIYEPYDKANDEDNNQGMLQLHSRAPTPSVAVSPSRGISLPPSIALSPTTSIAERPSFAPSIENGLSPGPSTGPQQSPPKYYDDEEVHEWLPPAVGPKPEEEAQAPAPALDNKPAADELPSTLPSTTDANLGSKFNYKCNVILTGLILYAFALIL